MLKIRTFHMGSSQRPCPVSHNHIHRSYLYTINRKCFVAQGVCRGKHYNAPFHSCRQLSTLTKTSASEIVADVLNQENKSTNAALLLELLDKEGWGVTADITRKFSTKFASVSLDASWDDVPSGGGRTSSRRLAVLATYQEWLVARNNLVGQVFDTLEELRAGYLPRDLVDSVRTARSAKSLTPNSDALDSTLLLLLAAPLLPLEALEAHLDAVLRATRTELLQKPAYRGRTDLHPSLDKGLELIRGSALWVLHLAMFRASHLKEALALESELRRQRLAEQPRTDETTRDLSSRAINERLYGGQQAPVCAPWMDKAERQRAASAHPIRRGPRGLPVGRVGLASYRPRPGAALYSYLGLSGSGSFGSSSRLDYSVLDSVVRKLLAREGNDDVPKGVLKTFARLHRTALLDLLSAWQWVVCRQEGPPPSSLVSRATMNKIMAASLAGFYRPSCTHAVSLAPSGPLQVTRRTRIEVSAGRELESLRSLVRIRSAEVLQVVNPSAWKEMVREGEWEYWRQAYRIWDQYAPLPKTWRKADLLLVLSPEQVPYVGLLEEEAKSRAAVARLSSPVPIPSDYLDMSNLTSMSSMDLEDAPLPTGSLATTTTVTTNPTTSSLGSEAASTAGSGLKSASSADADAQQEQQKTHNGQLQANSPFVQTETTVKISLPADEVRCFLLALLELLPRSMGTEEWTAGMTMTAAVARRETRHPPVAAGTAAASDSSRLGNWFPAESTSLQVRFSPMRSDDAGRVGSLAAAAISLSPAVSAPASLHTLPEELRLSHCEIRWALGSATLTTAPIGPSAATAFSLLNIPAAVGNAGGGIAAATATAAAPICWCAPMRLTQVQLLSLINIFNDLTLLVPDMFGVKPLRAVVRTLSPLQRVVSTVRGVAGPVMRTVGLLALLAVPLAAVLKAGGGGGGGGLGMTAMTSTRVGAAATAASAIQASQMSRRSVFSTPCAVPSAETAADDMPSSPRHHYPQHRQHEHQQQASLGRGWSPAEFAMLCQEVECLMNSGGRVWLEVTGTQAATLPTGGQQLLPRWVQNYPEVEARVAAGSWPEFQVVVERVVDQCAPGGSARVKVVGCRPVNVAGRAVLPELPLTAALRGDQAQKMVSEHLRGLTTERITQGRATPGRFLLPYTPATFHKLPNLRAAFMDVEMGGEAAKVDEMASVQQPSAGPTSEIAVVKLELRPSPEPSRHAVQGLPGRGQKREYAEAVVVVRPWYDSDSLRFWIENRVQLPALGQEMVTGLLDREDIEREAFLRAYERLAAGVVSGKAAAGDGYDELPDTAAADVTSAQNELEAVRESCGTNVLEPSTAAGGSTGLAESGSRGGGRVLKPQELSELELREALQHLFVSLGVPKMNVRTMAAGESGHGSRGGSG